VSQGNRSFLVEVEEDLAPSCVPPARARRLWWVREGYADYCRLFLRHEKGNDTRAAGRGRHVTTMATQHIPAQQGGGRKGGL